MPSFPPALSTGNPYVAQGIRRIYWVVTIANPASPTRVEMTAGTDLSQNVTALAGWGQTQNFAPRSVIGSATVGKIAGTIVLSDASMSFEAGQNSVDVRSLLVSASPPNIGYMLILGEGDVPAQKMNVFKSAIGAVTPQQVMGDTEAQIDVAFGIFSANFNVAIPANP